MSDVNETAVVAALRRSLRSFNYREYRRYWTGSGLAIITIRIQEVVLGWHILVVTDSALWLGLVAFAYGIPLLLFSPVTGLMADRFRRQYVVMGAMSLAAAVSLILGLLTLATAVRPILILLTSFAIGCAFTLFAPARLALLPLLVPSEQLFTASSMEYTGTRLMGLFGPLIAGLLLESLGIGPALLAQALLFFLAGLVFMKTGVAVGQPDASHSAGVGSGLREAVAYLRSEPRLLALVVLGLCIVPFGMTYTRLTQVFVRDVLNAGPTILGYALGLAGLGTSISGMVITMMKPIQRRGQVMIIAAVVVSVALALLAVSRRTPTTFALLFVVGLASGVYLTISHVVFQTETPDAVRGRVLSIWGMVWGLLPVTSLIAGALADWWGVAAVFAICGVICLLGSSVMGLTSSHLLKL